MEELISAVTVLADLGGTIIVTVMLYLVWQRLNHVTDRMVEILVKLTEAQAKDNGTFTHTDDKSP